MRNGIAYRTLTSSFALVVFCSCTTILSAKNLATKNPLDKLHVYSNHSDEVTTISWSGSYGEIVPETYEDRVPIFPYHVTHSGKLEWSKSEAYDPENPMNAASDLNCSSLAVFPPSDLALRHLTLESSVDIREARLKKQYLALKEGECLVVARLTKSSAGATNGTRPQDAASFTLYNRAGESRLLFSLPERRGYLEPERYLWLVFSPVLDVTFVAAYLIWTPIEALIGAAS